MSPYKSKEKKREYDRDRYARLKKETEEKTKKDPWVNEVYPGYEPPSETEAEDFDHVTPQEYDRGVSGFFETIEEDQKPEPVTRHIPEDKLIPEYERPGFLQELSGEALEEISRGISPLLFDRSEKIPEKDEKPGIKSTWGRIIGD